MQPIQITIMMKKLMYFFCVVLCAAAFCACNKEARNTAELVDPWLRERTPVNFRLDKQVGAAVISDDWRHDDQGSVTVQLVTGGLDMKAVKIVALDFEYPESEYCPTASVKVGDVLDLSSGKASFNVTAYNGETRTYTISFTEFVDPLVGTYGHVLVPGVLDSGTSSSMLIHGGWPDAEVVSSSMDKSWHWGTGYSTNDEEDNIVSFQLTEVDSDSGATFGTIVNYPGEDGLWANYVYNNSYDVNDYYRQIPVGASRWGKDADGVLSIYDKADDTYSNPLYVVELLSAGTYTYSAKDVEITSPLAFHRSFTHTDDEWVYNYNWPDTRWMVDNIRNTFWTMEKLGDTAAADHAEMFEAYCNQ